MIVFSLAVKNVTRKRERSLLTVVGVMLAVGTLIALVSIAEGLYLRIHREVNSRAVDIYVSPHDALAMPMGPLGTLGAGTDLIPPRVLDYLKSKVEVANCIGLVRFSMTMEGKSITVWGIDPGEFPAFLPGFQFVKGGLYTGGDQMVVGSYVARIRSLEVGSRVMVGDREFEVTGIGGQSGGFLDYACFIPFQPAAELTRLPGYQELWVKVHNLQGAPQLAAELNGHFARVAARTRSEYLGAMDEVVRLAWLLQFAIAAIGVLIAMSAAMNTMLMSTYERIKEFGTLRAIGASRLNVVLMILSESIVLCLLGGVIGIIFGVMGSKLVDDAIRVLFQLAFPLAHVTWRLVGYSLLMSLAVGVVGALLPAFVIYRMSVIEALRWE